MVPVGEPGQGSQRGVEVSHEGLLTDTNDGVWLRSRCGSWTPVDSVLLGSFGKRCRTEPGVAFDLLNAGELLQPFQLGEADVPQLGVAHVHQAEHAVPPVELGDEPGATTIGVEELDPGSGVLVVLGRVELGELRAHGLGQKHLLAGLLVGKLREAGQGGVEVRALLPGVLVEERRQGRLIPLGELREPLVSDEALPKGPRRGDIGVPGGFPAFVVDPPLDGRLAQLLGDAALRGGAEETKHVPVGVFHPPDPLRGRRLGHGGKQPLGYRLGYPTKSAGIPSRGSPKVESTTTTGTLEDLRALEEHDHPAAVSGIPPRPGGRFPREGHSVELGIQSRLTRTIEEPSPDLGVLPVRVISSGGVGQGVRPLDLPGLHHLGECLVEVEVRRIARIRVHVLEGEGLALGQVLLDELLARRQVRRLGLVGQAGQAVQGCLYGHGCSILPPALAHGMVFGVLSSTLPRAEHGRGRLTRSGTRRFEEPGHLTVGEVLDGVLAIAVG